jgi:hypothetical protein
MSHFNKMVESQAILDCSGEKYLVHPEWVERYKDGLLMRAWRYGIESMPIEREIYEADYSFSVFLGGKALTIGQVSIEVKSDEKDVLFVNYKLCDDLKDIEH